MKEEKVESVSRPNIFRQFEIYSILKQGIKDLYHKFLGKVKIKTIKHQMAGLKEQLEGLY